MGPALIEPDHKFLIGEICLLKLAAMGPALIEPDHGQASRLRIDPGLLAAMGPALIEPDHTTMDELVAHLVDTPQWGRLSSSRITLPTSRRPREGGPPQWGRLSSSRITRQRHQADQPGAVPAAMGPALIEPDHTLRPSLTAPLSSP